VSLCGVAAGAGGEPAAKILEPPGVAVVAWIMRLRPFQLAAVALLALVAADSSAQTCDASTRAECVRLCPTVRSCRTLLTATCTGSECSRKEIRKVCKRRVKRCKASCRTPCLRSCEGQHPDCIAAFVSNLPECDPTSGEDVPLYCEEGYDYCFRYAVGWCRQEECCGSFETRVAITHISCEGVECGPCLPGEHGRRWTYVLSGTVSGGLGTRFVADGRIQDLECEGWTEVEVPLQGPSCVRTDVFHPLEIEWHASGSEDPAFFPNGCRCSTDPWVTEISVIANGPLDTATDHEPVTCP
jgi:hypothetical protein